MGWFHCQIEREIPRGKSGSVVPRRLSAQRPVVDVHIGIASIGKRQAEAAARRALVVLELAGHGITQCDIGEQQLLRREAAWVGLVELRARAEERNLEAERRSCLRLQPAGGIPPFGAIVGVRAVVAREGQGSACVDWRISGRCAQHRGRHAGTRQQQQE
ncbi:hypothetical protein D3C72_1470140 [compost metagenome]